MATTITVLSEDGKSKITLKSLPPMKPLRDCLLECASKLGMISESSINVDALEFRSEDQSRGKGSSSSSGGVKVDMDCPLRHLNLPTNAKLKVVFIKKRTLTVGSDVVANEESSLRRGGGEAPPLHVKGASSASAANDAAEKKDKKEDETMERSAILSDDDAKATSSLLLLLLLLFSANARLGWFDRKL